MKIISVIVPCYNVNTDLFYKCLTSILIQNIDDMEIILVDDGSSIPLWKILEQFKICDSRIKIFRQKNSGVSAARNKGVINAKGRYIIFVDSDDELTPHCLEKALKIIQQNNIDILVGGNALSNQKDHCLENIKNPDPQYRILTEQEKSDFIPYLIGDVYYFYKHVGYFGRGPWTRIIKRDIALENSFNQSLAMGEDIVWNTKLFKNQEYVIAIAFQVWYLYYTNPDSANHHYNEKMFDNVEKELAVLETELDMHNSHQFSAFCMHLLDESVKIYNCYLGNSNCTLSKNDKKKQLQRFYHETPWKYLYSLKFWVNSNRRYRVKQILYISHLWFLALWIKMRA